MLAIVTTFTICIMASGGRVCNEVADLQGAVQLSEADSSSDENECSNLSPEEKKKRDVWKR